MPDDDAVAIILICRILHSQYEHLPQPKTLDISNLRNLAITVDKYDIGHQYGMVTRVVGSWVIEQLHMNVERIKREARPAFPIGDAKAKKKAKAAAETKAANVLKELFAITYLLKDPSSFESVSSHLLTEWTDTFAVSQAGPTWEILPESVIGISYLDPTIVTLLIVARCAREAPSAYPESRRRRIGTHH